jgi:DNA-binding transcriptional LysR family regulator
MEDLEIFVAVVESDGFTAAAEALGMTVTATSRHLKALEQRLGVRLLHRTTRRIRLTEAGQIYFDQARRILAELRETEAQLAQLANEPQGQLRIAAPMSFGLKRLAPLVTRFARTHPRLQVQLQLDDRIVDIVEQSFDLALRIGHPRDSSLVARPLLPIPRHICASPEYLAVRGTPRKPGDLLHHNCLHYNNLSLREEWTLGGRKGPETIEVKGSFCSNNGDVLCEAACQGLGIVMLPGFIVEDALADGRLQRILEDFEPPAFTLYALYPTRQFVPVKIRLFLEFLTAALAVRTVVV